MQWLTDADNGRSIDINEGETATLTLSENATTGYRWAIDSFNSDVIELVDADPSYSSSAVGSGGEVSFKIHAKKSGEGDLALKKWRHWEGDSSVTERFRLKFLVREAV